MPEKAGELVAAFTGNHGWFWRNRTDAPVTVTLRTARGLRRAQGSLKRRPAAPTLGRRAVPDISLMPRDRQPGPIASFAPDRRNRRFSTHPEWSSLTGFLDATLMPNTTDHMSSRDGLPMGIAKPMLLPDEVLDFIQSGVSVIVGVVGPDGRAQAGRALASRVVAGGKIRLMYPDEGHTAIMASAQSGGPIAVTYSAPISHRTIQIKSSSSRAEEMEPDDRISLEAQIDAFAAVLRAIGFPQHFVQAFCANRSVSAGVVSFVPEAAYEQTPGPGAGREL